MHRTTTLAMATAGMLLASGVTMAEDHDFYAYSTSFSPTSVDVMPGDTIHWHYAAGYPHTVTFGSDCIWDGGLDELLDGSNPEVVWTVPLDQEPGAIPFFCDPHCTYDMAGVINVLEPVEPGRLVFGLVDIADCYLNMGVNPATGIGLLLVESNDGHFAFGFEVEENDLDVTWSASGNVYKTDASGTTAITPETTTFAVGSKFAIHGKAGVDFTMSWQDEAGDNGADLLGIECNECSAGTNGDMASFRTADGAYMAFRGGGSIQMSVIGNVTSPTLTLPAFGEEGEVVLPDGVHYIYLDATAGDDELAWVVMQMGEGDDGGGDDDDLPQDVNGDCVVDVNDLLSLIGAWGSTCP